jgi:hypothetical protein
MLTQESVFVGMITLSSLWFIQGPCLYKCLLHLWYVQGTVFVGRMSTAPRDLVPPLVCSGVSVCINAYSTSGMFKVLCL